MNKPLRRVAVAVLLLFGLLLVNVNYLQTVRADKLRNDERNSRVLLRTYAQERGSISLVDGTERTVLARSIETDDQLKYLRQYPGGSAFAHVTGFYSIFYGGTAIERQADEVLSG